MRTVMALVLAGCAALGSLDAQQMLVHPKLDTTVVHPRDHIVVPIVVAGDVASIQMTLSYATTRVTLDSLRSADSHWTVTSNITTPGKVVWNAFAVPGGGATVARAFFTVKSSLGTTALTSSIAVVGTLAGVTVTNGYTTERLILCVRASGTTC